MKITYVWGWRALTVIVAVMATSFLWEFMTSTKYEPKPVSESKVKEWVLTNEYGELIGNVRVLANGDTIKHFPEGKYQVINTLGTVIEEGTEEGDDGHPCGCSPDKHGIVIHRYPEGRLKEIATYWCGEKVGPWISYSPEGEKTSHNLRQ